MRDLETGEVIVVWAIEAADTVARFPERYQALDPTSLSVGSTRGVALRTRIEEFRALQHREPPRPAGSSVRRPHWDSSRGRGSATPAGSRDMAAVIPPLDSRRRR